MTQLDLQQRLANLNEVVLSLTRSISLDELFRRAIELGLEKLDFDRLGIGIVSEDPNVLGGTYGTDENGHVRNESTVLHHMPSNPALMRYVRKSDQRHAALLSHDIRDLNANVIASGWNAAVGLWDGETIIGYLFADNLTRGRPYSDDDDQILSMYASSIGHLYTHLQLEESLENRRIAANTFLAKMAVLNKLTIRLTRCQNLGELCYEGVRLGRQELGFDRLGLWFVDAEFGHISGTYGIDESGKIRSEYDRYMTLSSDQLFERRLRKGERYIYEAGIIIPDPENRPLAYGWKAAAALWNGEQIIGYLLTDNLLSRASYTIHDGELLALYAMLLGHLCSRLMSDESLREREASYRTLVEAIPDYMFVLNDTGSVVSFHESQESTLQFLTSSLVGCTLHDFFPPALTERCLNAMKETLATNSVSTFEYELTEQDLLHHLEFRMNSGSDNSVIMLVRDITDRKMLEKQLHASQKMESLGRMAGGIAHDFNNFLTVIQGFSGLALSMTNDTSPRLRSALERIETASAKAAHLTNQLLLFARKQSVKPQYLNVDQLIADTKTILLPLIGESIQLETKLNATDCHIYMDPGQLEQVIINLAVNARDAMENDGKLTIATRDVQVLSTEDQLRLQIPTGNYVLIEVRDTGCGMSESVRQQLFEPFFTTKEKGKGTGLGLAICHSIVQQNGGYLQVESVVGEGTLFLIFLPQKEASAKYHVDESLPTPISGVGTILLVEDDEPVREVVEQVLSMNGYTVLACATGLSAINTARTTVKSIDLLITDMSMPQMGGREVAEEFLTLYPETPVLLVSGYVEELPEALLKRNNVRFLPKPYTAATLTGIVQQSLNPKTN